MEYLRVVSEEPSRLTHKGFLEDFQELARLGGMNRYVGADMVMQDLRDVATYKGSP